VGNLSKPYDLLTRLRKKHPVARFHQAGFNCDQFVGWRHTRLVPCRKKVARQHWCPSGGDLHLSDCGGRALRSKTVLDEEARRHMLPQSLASRLEKLEGARRRRREIVVLMDSTSCLPSATSAGGTQCCDRLVEPPARSTRPYPSRSLCAEVRRHELIATSALRYIARKLSAPRACGAYHCFVLGGKRDGSEKVRAANLKRSMGSG
jgi:hypothetical protein